jgi:thymidine phosphorylase
MHAADAASADEAERRVRQAITLGEQPAAAPPLVYQTIRHQQQEKSA